MKGHDEQKQPKNMYDTGTNIFEEKKKTGVNVPM